jgi:hypothetical protein
LKEQWQELNNMATSIVSTQATNTPSIIAGNGSSAVTLLAANQARIGFSIQNVGTTTAYILFGASASSTVYHYAVKGGSSDNDGLGGSISFFTGAVYDGIITVYGASTAKCVCLEIAP